MQSIVVSAGFRLLLRANGAAMGRRCEESLRLPIPTLTTAPPCSRRLPDSQAFERLRFNVAQVLALMRGYENHPMMKLIADLERSKLKDAAGKK